MVEKDTKTHTTRRIALDPDTVATLRAQRERIAERLHATGVPLAEDAHVPSADPDGARRWAPNDVTKTFIRARKRLALDGVRFHDLRHFAATRLLAAGVLVRTVSGRLGHANAATTLGVYARLVEKSVREGATTLGALLRPRGVGAPQPPDAVAAGLRRVGGEPRHSHTVQWLEDAERCMLTDGVGGGRLI